MFEILPTSTFPSTGPSWSLLVSSCQQISWASLALNYWEGKDQVIFLFMSLLWRRWSSTLSLLASGLAILPCAWLTVSLLKMFRPDLRSQVIKTIQLIGTEIPWTILLGETGCPGCLGNGRQILCNLCHEHRLPVHGGGGKYSALYEMTKSAGSSHSTERTGDGPGQCDVHVQSDGLSCICLLGRRSIPSTKTFIFPNSSERRFWGSTFSPDSSRLSTGIHTRQKEMSYT